MFQSLKLDAGNGEAVKNLAEFLTAQFKAIGQKIEKKKVVIDNLDPDIELLCLLSLLKVSRLIKVYISKEYRKQAKNRIDELLHYGSYDPNHLEMILSVIKAINDIMAARQAVITIAATTAAVM